jgi:hypothetical protein
MQTDRRRHGNERLIRAARASSKARWRAGCFGDDGLDAFKREMASVANTAVIIATEFAARSRRTANGTDHGVGMTAFLPAAPVQAGVLSDCRACARFTKAATCGRQPICAPCSTLAIICGAECA